MDRDFIEFQGEKIYFYIQRKKVKNMNLKVNIDKIVTISIPRKMSLEKAKEFVIQKANWIKKQQNFYNKFISKKENLIFENGDTVYLIGEQYNIKLIKDTKNNIEITNKYIEIHIKEKYIENKKYIKNVYEKWIKQYALDILEKQVLTYQEILKKYNIKIPKVEIRKMKSRWGSCIPSYNKVIFNLNLIKTPMYCIEYVVLHELAHFKHQDHSKNFYNFINIFMPDWKERRKILNQEYIRVV